MKWNKRCPECTAYADEIDLNNPQVEISSDFTSAKIVVFCDHCGATIELDMTLDNVRSVKE